MEQRITYLDGHRGLAILLVIAFHAYVRWPEIVPYGNSYAENPVFKFGWVGVELFFMLSGFVILMTLEKCGDFKEFLYRRWLRLFPAMFICSLLIFSTASCFYERPAGNPSIYSLMPGLAFIEPSWLKMATGLPWNSLEGAFWSLYVEVKFYFFAGVIYYWRGRYWLFGALSAAYAASLLGLVAARFTTCRGCLVIKRVSEELSFDCFGWFAVGAALYLYVRTKERKWFIASILLALASSAFVRGFDWRAAVAAGCVSAVFAVSFISPVVRKLLNSRFLQFFGFISYPLYLLHENMMIAIIAKLGKADIALPGFLYPLPAVIILSGVAYFIGAYGEGYLKGLLLRLRRVSVRR